MTAPVSAPVPADVISRLKAVLGPDGWSEDPDRLAPKLVEWRDRWVGTSPFLVLPKSTADVAAVVAICFEAGQAITTQGGNTGLVGGQIPQGEILLSTERLRTIREVEAYDDVLVAEAGVTLSEVHAAAANVRRRFPLGLASEGSATVGGVVSTNAGGTQVLRYGMTRNLVLGLEAVLPTGEIWNGLKRLRKDNTGYDLKQLYVGAEGTLGIITAAVMKLFPLPLATATAWLAIDSPRSAVRLLADLQAAFGAALTACELVSNSSLCLVLKHIPGAQPPLSESPWHLLVELSGAGDEQALHSSLEAFLEQALVNGTVADAVLAQSVDQARRLWALRENISEAQKIDGISIKHDVSVPISRIGDFVERADAALQQAFPGIRIVAFGHVGDGNLHYNQSRAEAGENAAFIAATPQVNEIVHDIVHQLGGSISAEHGIGQLKREELLRYKSRLEMDLMRAVKRALDPQGLMNPGKVL